MYVDAAFAVPLDHVDFPKVLALRHRLDDCLFVCGQQEQRAVCNEKNKLNRVTNSHNEIVRQIRLASERKTKLFDQVFALDVLKDYVQNLLVCLDFNVLHNCIGEILLQFLLVDEE